MKLHIFSAIGLGLLLSACHSNPAPTSLAPGTYEDTDRRVNANGTEVERTTTTNVYRNTDGTKSATVESTTTRDPEGLFNKETTSKTVRHY